MRMTRVVGMMCVSLSIALFSLAAGAKPREPGLPGDLAPDGSILPCIGMREAAQCGAAIYHTRHLGLVKNGMRSQKVRAIMHVPTIQMGGSGDGKGHLCYSVVFGPKELKCVDLSNDVVSGVSDR